MTAQPGPIVDTIEARQARAERAIELHGDDFNAEQRFIAACYKKSDSLESFAGWHGLALVLALEAEPPLDSPEP